MGVNVAVRVGVAEGVTVTVADGLGEGGTEGERVSVAPSVGDKSLAPADSGVAEVCEDWT